MLTNKVITIITRKCSHSANLHEVAILNFAVGHISRQTYFRYKRSIFRTAKFGDDILNHSQNMTIFQYSSFDLEL